MQQVFLTYIVLFIYSTELFDFGLFFTQTKIKHKLGQSCVNLRLSKASQTDGVSLLSLTSKFGYDSNWLINKLFRVDDWVGGLVVNN